MPEVVCIEDGNRISVSYAYYSASQCRGVSSERQHHENSDGDTPYWPGMGREQFRLPDFQRPAPFLSIRNKV